MVLIESKNMPDSTIDPNLSNPQALVDAALSDTTTPKPSLPTLEPLQPSEPVSVEKTPEVAVAEVKVPDVKVETNNIEMSEEMPLQFVQPSEPVTQPTPSTEPTTPPPLPNPPMPPSPTVVDSQAMKPKSKLGVVVGGVLLLVLALGAGVWGYLGSPTKKEPVKVAEVGANCSDNPGICDESKGEACIKTKGKEEYKCKATGGQDPCRHTICPVNYYCVNDDGEPDEAWCEPKGGSRPPGETLTCPPGTRSNGQCEDGVLRPPCCEPDTSPSPSPSTNTTTTMVCTGLTQTPSTTPVVGSKLTFTCSGSITPSSAGTLSYEFVYKLNAGGWKSLSNKTTNTAELTIATCGEYIVHCRACATINGSKQCDPVWKDVVIQ